MYFIYVICILHNINIIILCIICNIMYYKIIIYILFCFGFSYVESCNMYVISFFLSSMLLFKLLLKFPLFHFLKEILVDM